MTMELDGQTVTYGSERTHVGAPRARFRARYRPRGEPAAPEPGSIEHFLTERYCLYAANGGQILRAEVHHEPWPLQEAELDVEVNELGDWIGAPLRRPPALAHYAHRNDVIAWLPQATG